MKSTGGRFCKTPSALQISGAVETVPDKPSIAEDGLASASRVFRPRPLKLSYAHSPAIVQSAR